MKKIGARLCKQQSALPWCVLWGKLCFRKVELLQASFCYKRTVHILPLGSHTTWRQVICSVSVTFLATYTLPGRNSCFYRPLQKMCRRELFLYVPAFEDQGSFSCVVLLQEPSASWLLIGDLLQWVPSDQVLHLWVLSCSLAFMVLVVLQFRCFFSLTPECKKIWLCVLPLICPQAWGTNFPDYLDCNYPCSWFLLIPTQLVES